MADGAGYVQVVELFNDAVQGAPAVAFESRNRIGIDPGDGGGVWLHEAFRFEARVVTGDIAKTRFDEL